MFRSVLCVPLTGLSTKRGQAPRGHAALSIWSILSFLFFFFFPFEVSKFNLSSVPFQTWWGRTGNGAVLIEQIVHLLCVPWIPISNEQPSINGGTADVGSAPASKWKSTISRDGTVYVFLDQNTVKGACGGYIVTESSRHYLT